MLFKDHDVNHLWILGLNTIVYIMSTQVILKVIFPVIYRKILKSDRKFYFMWKSFNSKKDILKII